MALPILSLALPSETGRVLSIQSHTVQGYVGNKSVAFPLQLLGYDVDPVNSVHSNHTGYIGSVSFFTTVLEVVSKLHSINPKLTYVCDPMMGDDGKLYVPSELVSVYRKKVSENKVSTNPGSAQALGKEFPVNAPRVVPVASMLIPNQFEAEQLTGFRDIISNIIIKYTLVTRLALKKMVGKLVTFFMLQDHQSINIEGNLLLIGSHQKEKDQSPEQFKIVIPKIHAYFMGTGDLTTVVLLGWSNKYPDNLDKAAELAVSSLQEKGSRIDLKEDDSYGLMIVGVFPIRAGTSADLGQ